MSPKSFIIIVSYNSQEYIQACLLSVTEQRAGSWFLVAADNHSQDGTVETIRQVRNFSPKLGPDNFKFIRFKKNHGFAGAVNRIFFKVFKHRTADFDYLVLINPDLCLARGALAKLVQPFEIEPRIGVCGAQILDYQTHKVQHMGGTILPNFITRHRGQADDFGKKDACDTRTGDPMARIRDVTYATGAFFGTRTSLFTDLGGLDTGYRPAYFEELDYCLKAARANFRVVVNPLARARHAQAASTTRFSPKFYRLYHKNRIRCAVLHAPLPWGRFLKEEMRWIKKEATRDQYGPLALAYGANLLFFAATCAVRIKNHFILNRLRLK